MKYYPYLRGRQNELIALRELATKKLLSGNIIPIVEPLTVSSTLLSTLKAFKDNKLKLAVIMNPEYGSFFQDNDKEDIKKEIINLLNDDDLVIKAYIMENDLDLSNEDIHNLLIINKKHDSFDEFFKTFKDGKYPLITLIPDDRLFKRKLNSDNKVLLEDCFNKQARNSDYENNKDEFFSDGLQLYDDGFDGFSDYSIVGKEYVESGFAPSTVVIHLIYNKDDDLRIHHFTSANNDNVNDIAGMYGKSVEKLYNWNQKYNVYKTQGLKDFLESYSNQKYPGLGVVKRWSIMHHLQLVDYLLRDINENR